MTREDPRLRGLGPYRVMFGQSISWGRGSEYGALFTWERHPGNFDDLVQAKRMVDAYKRKGMTAFVVDSQDRFVPVPGAMRAPKSWSGR